jgi:excisionase family DNA binding protein
LIFLLSVSSERDNSDDLLTTGLVARELDITPDTVRFHERRGHLQAIRTVGGQRIFTRAAVDKFKATRRVPGRGASRA